MVLGRERNKLVHVLLPAVFYLISTISLFHYCKERVKNLHHIVVFISWTRGLEAHDSDSVVTVIVVFVDIVRCRPKANFVYGRGTRGEEF